MGDWRILWDFSPCLFGCGSVCAAVATGAQVGVFQVAIVWGIGIATAIYLTGSLSSAHLNPAVTIASAAWARFPARLVIPYIIAQMIGAFAAAALLYAVFGGAIAAYESKHGIVRGEPGSEATAMVFGEYFPNPSGKPLTDDYRAIMTPGRAFAAEVVGTAILLLVIFGSTDERNTTSAPGPDRSDYRPDRNYPDLIAWSFNHGLLQSRARFRPASFLIACGMAERALYNQRPGLANCLHPCANHGRIAWRSYLPAFFPAWLSLVTRILGLRQFKRQTARHSLAQPNGLGNR